MAFYTSWRLSMLAFTTVGPRFQSSLYRRKDMKGYTSPQKHIHIYPSVLHPGPIMYVTKAYAQWSSEQNRKILAALGEANSSATEALANVRTVFTWAASKNSVGV